MGEGCASSIMMSGRRGCLIGFYFRHSCAKNEICETDWWQRTIEAVSLCARTRCQAVSLSGVPFLLSACISPARSGQFQLWPNSRHSSWHPFAHQRRMAIFWHAKLLHTFACTCTHTRGMPSHSNLRWWTGASGIYEFINQGPLN